MLDVCSVASLYSQGVGGWEERGVDQVVTIGEPGFLARRAAHFDLSTGSGSRRSSS